LPDAVATLLAVELAPRVASAVKAGGLLFLSTLLLLFALALVLFLSALLLLLALVLLLFLSTLFLLLALILLLFLSFLLLLLVLVLLFTFVLLLLFRFCFLLLLRRFSLFLLCVQGDNASKKEQNSRTDYPTSFHDRSLHYCDCRASVVHDVGRRCDSDSGLRLVARPHYQ
jgi:hypothetical protein